MFKPTGGKGRPQARGGDRSCSRSPRSAHQAHRSSTLTTTISVTVTTATLPNPLAAAPAIGILPTAIAQGTLPTATTRPVHGTLTRITAEAPGTKRSHWQTQVPPPFPEKVTLLIMASHQSVENHAMAHPPPPTHQPHQTVTIFHNKDVVGYTGSASSIINVNGVFNISSYDLTVDELSLSSKGLSFSPTPHDLDLSEVRSTVE